MLPAAGGLVQLLGRHRDPGELGEHRAQGAGGLAFGRQEAAQIAADLGGQGEQPDRFGGRRHIEDEQVPGARGVLGAQGVQQREGLGAGEFGEFVLVQGGGAEQIEGGSGAFLEGEELLAEALAGVDAAGVQAGGYRGRGIRGRRRAQYGLGRLAAGGQQQDARSPPGAGQGGRGGERGAARAAGAGEQEGLHAQSFLPSSAAEPSADPLSTRFLRPASARSMMTFSALRLIIPSIGIFTSTVSR